MRTIISLFLCFTSISLAQDITFKKLLDQMVDREELAEHPDGKTVDFTLHQVSSYDKRTKPIGDQSLGQPASFANLDFSQYIRTETNGGRTEYVMMDETGPGAIVHIWLTGGNFGTLRIYLDGATTPTYEGTADDVIAGTTATTLFGAPLAFKSRNHPNTGNNLNAPFPYQTSCKITYDRHPTPTPGSVDNLWYNINFLKYPAGTTVETYSEAVRAAAQTELNATNAALNSPTTVTGNVSTTHSNTSISLPTTGSEHTYTLPSGNAAIRRLSVKLSATDLAEALRTTSIQITFDGIQTVNVPVGHFFGTGDIGLQTNGGGWSDWFRTVEVDGTLQCRWVMPYQTSGSVKLINNGTQNISAELEVDSGSYTWTANSMHFHADYRSEFNINTRGTGGNYSENATGDFNYLYVKGKGVYVGDTLTIRNAGGSGNQWWGEGDEKIYVDGEAFPSFVGTGTEDYYCYAFSHTETFITPWATQPTGAGNLSAGQSINSRVRLLDTHPFQTSYRFDMEIWHWINSQLDFRSVAYWYGVPGATAMYITGDAATDFPASPGVSVLYDSEGTAGNAVTTLNGDGLGTTAPTLNAQGDPTFSALTPPTNGGSTSIEFDGNDYLHSDTVPTSVTDNFGVEAWVRPTALDSFNFVVSNGNSDNRGWGIIIQGGTWRIAHMGSIIGANTPTANLNQWTHVALVRANSVSTLYVNGVAQATTIATPPLAPSNSFTIGANELTAGNFEGFFQGQIDHVRVFTFPNRTFDPAIDLSFTSTTAHKIGTSGSSETWSYHSSSHANPSAAGATVTELTAGNVGTSGNSGFGGGQGAENFPAASTAYIQSNGSDNIPIQGSPGYHEIQLHPGAGAVNDTANPSFVFARWTAPAGQSGTAKILGAVRNLLNSGDSVNFAIYHNGVSIYSQTATGTILPEESFDLERTIAPNDTIEFVVGNNGNSNNTGDEVALRAQIFLISGTPDADNDGLLNWQESIVGTNINASDTDNDGQSDSEEDKSGSNPLDAASVFSITSVQSDNTGVNLTWLFKAGNTYTIQRRASWSTGSWGNVATGVTLDNWKDVSPEASSGNIMFYRVRVE